MSAHKSYRAESRRDWGAAQDGNLTLEQINTGALLRIADATEAMAKNYTSLLAESNYLKRRLADMEAECRRLNRSNNALRGVVTRMRKLKGGEK